MVRFRVLISVLLAACFVLVAVSDADAQRRRRRRRRPPQEETQQAVEPPADDAANPDTGAEGGGEGEIAGDGEGGVELPPAEFAGGDDELPPEDGGEGGEGAASDPEVTPVGEDAYADEGPDLGPIREEFTALMDELVQIRSRVAVLGRQLFRTRLTVDVQNRADDQSLARMILKLDGAPIFQGDGGEVPEDGRQVFEGFAAPGPHVLTVEVEQRARADDEYRYELRDTFRFQVLRNRVNEVEIVLDDDSDIGEDFADDEEGEFDVRTRISVATRALDD